MPSRCDVLNGLEWAHFVEDDAGTQARGQVMCLWTSSLCLLAVSGLYSQPNVVLKVQSV